jgi:hypothetical protein
MFIGYHLKGIKDDDPAAVVFRISLRDRKAVPPLVYDASREQNRELSWFGTSSLSSQ